MSINKKRRSFITHWKPHIAVWINVSRNDPFSRVPCPAKPPHLCDCDWSDWSAFTVGHVPEEHFGRLSAGSVLQCFQLYALPIHCVLVHCWWEKEMLHYWEWKVIVSPVSVQRIFIIYLNNSETKINAVLSGTYWIYSIYPPNYVPTSTGDHCHRTLYLFAFWINNLGFLCVFILSLLCLYTILTHRHILFNRTLYVKI